MSTIAGRFASIPSLVSIVAAGFLTSACVIAVDADHDDWDDSSSRSYRNRVDVRLTTGKRAEFRCPRGYRTFVEDREGEATKYGCEVIDDDED